MNVDIARGSAALGLTAVQADRRGPHLLGVDLPEAMREPTRAALERAGCFAAIRGGALRIAPRLHTTDADVTCLLDALGDAAEC